MVETLPRKLTWPNMADYYPEPKTSGDWKIDTFELDVEKVKWEVLRAAFGGWQSYWATFDLKPGRYARLTCKREVIMSDTPFERRTNEEVLRNAEGDVLLVGLGLGMLPIALLDNHRISSLTILERSPDVIAMVKPVVMAAAAEAGYPFPIDIVQGDAWKPEGLDAYDYLPERFDYVWLDIWGAWNGDQWTDIVALRRLWRKRTVKGGTIRGWIEDTVKRLAREDGETATPERVRKVLAEHRPDL